MANSYNFGYGTGGTTGTVVIIDDDTIYFNYDPSSTQTTQGELWAHQIGEIDDEPEKEEPDEQVDRCYPTRHEDEILRIIMQKEVWRPPKRERKPSAGYTRLFFCSNRIMLDLGLLSVYHHDGSNEL